MSDMQVRYNVRLLCSRVQTLLRHRRQKHQKRTLEISAPFDLKHEPVCLPGISEDEISILREKAVASRIGVAESMPHSPSYIRSPRPVRGHFPVSTVLPPYGPAPPRPSRPIW